MIIIVTKAQNKHTAKTKNSKFRPIYLRSLSMCDSGVEYGDGDDGRGGVWS